MTRELNETFHFDDRQKLAEDFDIDTSKDDWMEKLEEAIDARNWEIEIREDYEASVMGY